MTLWDFWAQALIVVVGSSAFAQGEPRHNIRGPGYTCELRERPHEEELRAQTCVGAWLIPQEKRSLVLPTIPAEWGNLEHSSWPDVLAECNWRGTCHYAEEVSYP